MILSTLAKSVKSAERARTYEHSLIGMEIESVLITNRQG